MLHQYWFSSARCPGLHHKAVKFCCALNCSAQGDGGLKKTILKVGESWEKPEKGDECTGKHKGASEALCNPIPVYTVPAYSSWGITAYII